jgi:tetratricopeptide (TPR) repeat protein
VLWHGDDAGGEELLRGGLEVVAGEPGEETALERLAHRHVASSVLEGPPRSDRIVGCRCHRVVDPARGGVFSCFEAWRRGDVGTPAAEDVGRSWCPECMTRSLQRASCDLARDRGARSGHGAVMTMAATSRRQGDSRRAAILANVASTLAGSAPERAAAALLEGLCLLDDLQLAEADAALLRARGSGADPGLVAYHRGQVQMAWRDDIEALERFQEALAGGCREVPEEDLRLAMAMSHVRLEEYEEARCHVEAVKEPTHASVFAFYRGLCDLGSGDAEAALHHLERALEAGPGADDLGRVLLYLATCLKELGRFEEAVEHLERATEIEADELAHHNLLGYCHYALGRHEEAVAVFRRALEIAPESAIDWSNVAANLRELGRLEDAEAAYERALSLDPTLGLARRGLDRTRGLISGRGAPHGAG